MSPTPQSAPHRQPSGPVAAPRQCLWPRRAQLAAAGPSANISPSGAQWHYGDSVTLSTGIIRMIDAATWLISLSCGLPVAIPVCNKTVAGYQNFWWKTQCRNPTKQNRQWGEAAENTNVICHEGEVDTVDSSVCCSNQSEVKLNLYLLNTRYNVQTFAADHLSLLLQKVTKLFILCYFHFCALT